MTSIAREAMYRSKKQTGGMFQSRADDARGEAGSLRRLATLNLRMSILKNSPNCWLRETDERRRKKSEALTTLENAHRDYYEMKMRMHMEIPGLLNRMEAAKQLLGGHKFKTWKLSLAEIEGNIATIDPCGLTLPELA
ncbi:hypothetical protein T459_21204 [Capsicum annuum]|uniref:Oberon coiled-coil region domain-containing protein n=1 Tax=Capsicum annuum TaxID=4072 RepID=A0A2G2YVZ0_CAPAN|nr:hypothetical protein T459_21204 [Capsicum annuum]